MRYFVVASDGQLYGPADLDTLRVWVAEGRVTPTTMLEEEIGAARLAASGLAGLFGEGASVYDRPAGPDGGFEPNTPAYGSQTDLSQNPYASQSNTYFRPTGAQPMFDPLTQRLVTNAWVAGAVGLGLITVGFCCFLTPLASVGLSIWGISSGRKAMAAGHAGGQAAFIFNVVVLVISLGVLALYLLFFSAGFML